MRTVKPRCGVWMPIAGTTCARPIGHPREHLSAKALEGQRRRVISWYAANPNYRSQWYANHPGYGTSWWRANREKSIESSKRSRARNPEPHRLAQQRRRAQKLGSYHEHYTRLMLLDAWGVICYLCDNILPNDWHIDHVVPLLRGGTDTVANCRPTCPSCNLSKGAKLLKEMC